MNRILCSFFLALCVGVYSLPSLAQELKSAKRALTTMKEYDAYKSAPLSAKYGGVTAVKVVYDLTAKKGYFLNGNVYQYHHEFCHFELRDPTTVYTYNEINYTNNPHRKYLLANLNYNASKNQFYVEIAPSDEMTLPQIITLDSVIRASFFTHFSFLLNTQRLMDMAPQLKQHMEVVTSGQVFENITYQCVSAGNAVGYVVFVDDLTQQWGQLHDSTIVVLNSTPLILPRVAGVIVKQMQTPLSHLAVLGANRGMPIGASTDPAFWQQLESLNGKKVALNVGVDGVSVHKTQKKAHGVAPKSIAKLKFDLSEDSLRSIQHLNRRSYRYAGSKAANLGALYTLSKKADFKVPESGFVIPFHFYDAHIILNLNH